MFVWVSHPWRIRFHQRGNFCGEFCVFCFLVKLLGQLCSLALLPWLFVICHPPLSSVSHAALKKQSPLPHLQVGLQPTFSDFHSHHFLETLLPVDITPSAKSRGPFVFSHLVPVLQATLEYSFLLQPHSSLGSLLLSFKLLFLIFLHMVCPPPQAFFF